MRYLILATLLTGCAQKLWYGNGDFEVDRGQCQAQAFSIPNAPTMQVAVVYNACMRGKGWVLR